ncbi:MAG: hypothetical protein U0270_13375 [Labilithrix sp.]
MRIAALALATWVATTSAACSHDDKDPIPNVRLGMAPRDVRDRFHPSESDPGAWQTALGAGDDTVLEWTARDPKTPMREARFEFHLGMLVAIRAKTTDKLGREEISTTPKTVTVKAPKEGGGTITVLARDCPTHKDEAEGYATKAR